MKAVVDTTCPAWQTSLLWHSSPGYLQRTTHWCTNTLDYDEINFGWSSKSPLTLHMPQHPFSRAHVLLLECRVAAPLSAPGQEKGSWGPRGRDCYVLFLQSVHPSERKQHFLGPCSTRQVANKLGSSCKVTNFSFSLQLTWLFPVTLFQQNALGVWETTT